MATVGSLIVNVSARTEQLARGLASAKRQTKAFRRDLGDVASSALRMGTFLTGATTAALIFYTKRSMDAIDTTAKLADRIGVSTEALTALHHQGELAGNSAEDVDAALEKLTKTLGEAKQGTGAGVDGLKALGLSLSQLNGLSVDQKLGLIGDRLKGMTDLEKRAVAITDLFGKSGQKLGNMLLEGSDGIAKARKEAEALGLTFSRVDAAKVEAANDSFTRLGALLQGVGNQLAIKIAPFIEKVNSKLVMMGVEGNGAAGIVSVGFEKMISFISIAGQGMSGLVGSLQALAAGGLIVRQAFNAIKASDLNITNMFDDPMETQKNFEDETKILDAAFNDLVLKSAKSFDAINDTFSIDALHKFFNDINTEADVAAKNLTDSLGDSIANANVSELGSKSGGGGPGFRQVDLTKTVLNTNMKTKQVVEDPQLKETNRLLSIMGANIGVGFGAT